uniref:Uncharacterized protein n=1 Tax=viral metagenome TaxID=1070528 RepID=A0A6C0KGE1_9ZZZZ
MNVSMNTKINHWLNNEMDSCYGIFKYEQDDELCPYLNGHYVDDFTDDIHNTLKIKYKVSNVNEFKNKIVSYMYKYYK